MNGEHEPTDLPPPDDSPARFTPDSDDLRPFLEVCEESVDRQIREIIMAAHAARLKAMESESGG
jgi:hypothetical protein